VAIVAALAIFALLGLGVFGVWEVADPVIAVVAALVAAALLAFRFEPRGRVADGFRLPAAAFVGFLALVGLDIAVNAVFQTRVDVLLGLLVALAAFALVAYWYLLRLEATVPGPRGRELPLRALAALFVANALILLFPFVYGVLSADTKPVPKQGTAVPSELDLRIVTDGRPLPEPAELPTTPLLDEFDVSYSVGYAAGGEVRWTLVDGGDQAQALEAIAAGDSRPAEPSAPAPRPGADHVLLLLVDGTPPVVAEPAALPQRPGRPGEVARWRRLAHRAGGGGSGTFALLQTSDPARIAAWKGFVPYGEGVSEQGLASRTVTDAAVRLEVGAPNSSADLALATAFRPILLFDKDEAVPWPLSVSALFASGAVSLCHDQGTDAGQCKRVEHPRELESGDTHLQLVRPESAVLRQRAREELRRERRRLAAQQAAPGSPPPGTPGAGAVPESAATPLGAGSAIYVNPVEVGKRLYLDYWWYLPDNPVALGGGALCGAGLVIADVTCPSHESDWEGMTVVVGLGGRVPRIVAVQYAQHATVVRYGWGLLRRRWDHNPYVAKVTAGIPDAATRPIAYSAAGTHATYPTACTGGCQQVANHDLREEAHDGRLAWVGDFTTACGVSSCLQLLPTLHGGSQPALWNAYDGTWGEHHCLLGYFCDSAAPPTAPGTQGRYKNPAKISGTVSGPNWRYRPVENEG
jgi:hypothetical protein